MMRFSSTFVTDLSSIRVHSVLRLITPSVSFLEEGALIFAEHEISAEYYGNWDWNYGKSPKFELNRRQRFPIGSVEFKMNVEKGYIKGSRNIPFTELKNHVDALRSADHPIIIVCQMGMTAGTAVAMIGNDNVYRLDGGITNWQAAGLPLVVEKTVPGKTK